jgi:hypothetical protein
MKKSTEILIHFNCGFCSKWWSIGDAPKTKLVWYCPWCGKENKEEEPVKSNEQTYHQQKDSDMWQEKLLDSLDKIIKHKFNIF